MKPDNTRLESATLIEERISSMKESVQARIAVMKWARAEEKQRSEEEKAERRLRINERVAAKAKELDSLLMALADLPVRPNGVVVITTKRDDSDSNLLVLVRRYGWDDDGETAVDTLICFAVMADEVGERAWIEHDDTEVSIDVALDLATSVVEANLDA